MKNFRYVVLGVVACVVVSLSSCNNDTSTADKTAPTNTNKGAEVTQTEANSTGGREKININTAILSELDKFEAALGVPALSNKIQANRPYASPEELVSKNVINQEQFDKISDQVTIEEVVLTGEAKEVDYMTKLSLMKGHLLVARELLDKNQPKQAEPHIGHPVEEIYVDVEDELNEYNAKEFKTTLISLQDLVKAQPKNAKVVTNFEDSMQSIDEAITALPADKRSQPAFVLKVIDGLLDAASSEYGAAIANGKITAPIEYQDSRGFVAYADKLYQTVADEMAKNNPQAHKSIETSMTELTQAWPSVIPPAAPAKSIDEVSKLVKTIEQSSQTVIDSNTQAQR